MIDFLSGLFVAFATVAVVFFLRFRRDSGDRLFTRFAAAFAILAAERLALLAMPARHEASSWIYILRLASFAIMIWAMVEKNRGGSGRPPPRRDSGGGKRS